MTGATRRRAVADAIDALDNEIATLQDSKRDTFDDYRDKLSAEGMRDGEIKLEIKALKKAIARRRALLAKPAEVEEVDEKIDEITADIMKKSEVGTVRAARTHVARSASREATPHDPETGEITETGEVRAETSALQTAETSSSEAPCEHGAGAPMHPMDPAPQPILPAPSIVARAPLRTLPPRVPEPAPEMPDLPAFLDRSGKAEAE